GTIFNDLATATMHVVPKNVNAPNAPTSNNAVTITRVHVSYRRTDGHNQPGVDVPYPFDTATTATLPPDGKAGPVGFEVVGHDAKIESPLVDLRYKLVVLNTIAEVTFYGTDQVGNQIANTGYIAVNFADFGDAQKSSNASNP